MTERSHLAIGEVLTLLRDEFPDVTISKIRFLESQGLVDPERTPSGYRKFYEHDVERLRWILLQQKEHFLPLKVIKDRLEEIGEPGADHRSGDGGSAGPPAAEVPATPPPPPAPAPAPAAEPTPAPAPAAAPAPVVAASVPDLTGEVTPEPAPSDTTAEILAAHTGGSPVDLSPAPDPAPAPDPTPADVTGPAPAAPAAPLRPDTGPDTLTLEELAEAAGMEPDGIEELQGFGLLSPAGAVGGTAYFDLAALEVARTAAAFARHGVEARHLRAWRNGAEREAGMFEQIVMPLLRQRNPQARQQAEDTLAELAGLGGDLRAALVRQALSSIR